MNALRTAARLWKWRNPHFKLPTELRCYSSFHGRNQFGEINKFLKISEEVQDAVASSRPVVALETTIYTHASRLESIVREGGAVPATIGVLNGVARVGMAPDELAELASSSQTQKILKVSRRDLGYICGLGLSGKKMNGGTTIAGTMVLAHIAGIKVFATGGLGGVHRGGENSMDISADLTELGRTPVALISSGCKSFLDIPRTLEYLETEGVMVGVFADGREGSVDFPAFYTRNSGIKAQKIICDEAEAAAIIYAQSRLNISSGLVFANPVPGEFSFPKKEIDDIIEQALESSKLEDIHGSDNTPFVLAKIKELSHGKSVTTNTALVESNVERGTKVALELAKLEKGCQVEENRQSLGGVGHNVALAANYAGSSVLLCSVVADDLSGRAALSGLKNCQSNLQVQGIQVLSLATGSRTSQYVSVNDERKNLMLAMADMAIMETPEQHLDFDTLWRPLIHSARPSWIVIDANWSPDVIANQNRI
ncbi:IdgA domain-containing protein [Histoplasma capsulatum]|uniref:IdgA domain-containing protein n=1 Tax=Ajellomyces capsulatus TaxID=5037 RepID=A0A8A1M814_AJECA|nr:IdgA domain-containing protein [Histoplasma capsulatum]